MVAFPQWVEQKTNAKLIEDVWKTGVRVDKQVNDAGCCGWVEVAWVLQKCGEICQAPMQSVKGLVRSRVVVKITQAWWWW